MATSSKKQSSGLLMQAIEAAKKLSTEFQNVQGVSKTSSAIESVNPAKIVDGQARLKTPFDIEKYESPQQMLRQQLPKVSHQLLGRHYNKVNQVAAFISPDFADKVSDTLFDWLSEFSSNTSLTEKILAEAGVTELAELSKETARSQRLSQALIEQNKILAAAQGVVTGASGVWGATLDIPASIVLVLRTIYQTGRSHGFELNDAVDQEIVAFIFKEIDLSLVAEKQALLLALKAMKSMLETNDLQQFQQVLGSGNDIEMVKKWLVDEQGQLKWNWLNRIPQVSILGKLTPVAGAALSAVYSWRLLEDVGHKSQAIFGAARFYVNEHPNENISPLTAYFKAEELLKKDNSRLIKATETVQSPVESSHEAQKNDVIKQVVIQSKEEAAAKPPVEEKVEAGIQHLAEQHVAEHEYTTQQPALKAQEDELFIEDEVGIEAEQTTL